MFRSTWIYLLIVAAVGAGGWFYYSHQHTTVNQNTSATQTPNEGAVVQPKQADDELNKKRQEGIGSIKNLKPIPIEPSPAKNAAK